MVNVSKTELVWFCWFRMKPKYYAKYGKSRTLSSSLARNSTNAAWTSWSTVRPMFPAGRFEYSGKKKPEYSSGMKDTMASGSRTMGEREVEQEGGERGGNVRYF